MIVIMGILLESNKLRSLRDKRAIQTNITTESQRVWPVFSWNYNI